MRPAEKIRRSNLALAAEGDQRTILLAETTEQAKLIGSPNQVLNHPIARTEELTGERIAAAEHVLKFAREHSVEALEILVAIMRSEEAPCAVRVRGAEITLDQGQTGRALCGSSPRERWHTLRTTPGNVITATKG
jgi:hypothetical protein